MTTEEIAKVWLLTIKGGWIFSPKAFSREEHLSIVSAPFFLGKSAEAKRLEQRCISAI